MVQRTIGRIGLAALAISGLLATGMVVANVSPAQASDSLSDASFFGAWGGSSWTTAGKLDYAKAGLESVEVSAKAGNYTQAESDLLTFFRARNSPQALPLTDADRDDATADLVTQGVLQNAGRNETSVGKLSINGTSRTVSVDATAAVNATRAGSSAITLEVLAPVNDPAGFQFNSRESGSNGPSLTVNQAGTVTTLTPTADTYVRDSSYANSNYGSQTSLIVKGTEVNSGFNRRAFVTFDISSLGTSVTSATFNLFGSITNYVADRDVMVFTYGTTTWGETSFTWHQMKSQVLAWAGDPSGTAYPTLGLSGNPPLGFDAQYVDILCRLPMTPAVVHRYLETHDEKYASSLINIMVDLVDTTEPTSQGNYPYGTSGLNRSLDVMLRADAWIVAINYLKASPSMTAPAFTTLLKYAWTLGQFGKQTSSFHGTTNWGVSETKGLYELAVYFPEFADSSSWLSTATARFPTLFDNLLLNDNSYTEASSMYTGAGADGFLKAEAFGELNGQVFSDEYKSQVQRIISIYMEDALPNTRDPQYGDSDYAGHLPRIKTSANLYGRPDFTYFASAGAAGQPPSYTSVYRPTKREVVMRSGWDAEDSYLHFNDSGGPHGHEDDLSVIAYAYGKRLLVGGGIYAYGGTDISHWLHGTESSNSILVNGQSQAHENGTERPTAGTMSYWATNPAFDFVEAANSFVYPGKVMNRSVLFVKPGFWIVSDFVDTGSTSDTYSQLWHPLPGSGLTIDPTTDAAKTTVSGEPNLQIVPLDPSSITATVKSGYYSSVYGTVTSSDYVSYTKSGSGAVTFDTVLFPTNAGDTRTVSASPLTTSPAVARSVASAMKVNFDSGYEADKGYYYVSHEVTPTVTRSFGGYGFDGKMAYIQTSSTGSLKSALIRSGSSLTSSSSTIVSSTSSIDDLGLTWNGTSLEISSGSVVPSTGTGAIAIRAGSATSVKLNGTPIPSTSSGGMIYAVAPTPVWQSSSDFSQTQTLDGRTGTVAADFDVVPAADSIDGVIGFSGSSAAPSSWDDLAASVRMSPTGVFEAYNGGSGAYSADKAVPYAKQGRYHVHVVVDTTARVYSVVITPANGVSYLIADHYPFRSSAPASGDVGFVTVRSASAASLFAVRGLVTGSGTFPTPPRGASDTFDLQSTGVGPVGWGITAGGPDTVTVEETPSAADKSVRLTKASTAPGSQLLLKKIVKPISGLVTVEATVQKDQSTGVYNLPYVFGSSGIVYSMQFANGYIRSSVGGTMQNVASFTAGQWYDIKLSINTATDTYDLWVDGALKLNNAAVRQATDDVSSVWFFATDSSTGTARINNFAVK